jgi:hypothetical protein
MCQQPCKLFIWKGIFGSVIEARTRTLRLERAILALFPFFELHSVAHNTPINITHNDFVRFAPSCNIMQFLVQVSPYEPLKSGKVHTEAMSYGTQKNRYFGSF